MMSNVELVIRARKGWQPIDLWELWRYRELFGFLIWRDVRIRYSQTILGSVWAVAQPLLAMIVFTALFHRLAGLQSDGPPYPLFAFVGLTAWMFFSNAISASAASLIGSQQLISKVYFPRALIPLAASGAFALDLAVNLVFIGGMMAYYRWPLTAKCHVDAVLFARNVDRGSRSWADSGGAECPLSRRQICRAVLLAARPLCHPDHLSTGEGSGETSARWA